MKRMKRKSFFLGLTLVFVAMFLILSIFLPYWPTAPFTWSNTLAFSLIGAGTIWSLSRYLKEINCL